MTDWILDTDHPAVLAMEVADAKYLASKVKTDLTIVHRYWAGDHGGPSLEKVDLYEKELVLLLSSGFIANITYGYVVEPKWVQALCYNVPSGGVITADDDPGGIEYRKLPDGAFFSTILKCNSNWLDATEGARRIFLHSSPVERQVWRGGWHTAA